MQGRRCCFFGGVKSVVDMGIEDRFHMNESLWKISIRFLQHCELCEKSRHRAEFITHLNIGRPSKNKRS